MVNIAISNDIAKFIYPRYKAPAKVNEFNRKAIEENLKLWKAHIAGDAKMRLAITYNLKALPMQVVQGKKNAREI